MKTMGIFLLSVMNLFETKKVWLPINEHQQTEIIEEITPIHNQEGKIEKFNIYIEIPEDYIESRIIISPPIFDTINHYKTLTPGEKIQINLEIKNCSQYNYAYEKNSFEIKIKENQTTEQKEDIDNNFLLYRSYNEALKALYQNKQIDKNSNLLDSTLNKKLKEKGYQGVEQLDKYYLDFYNKKYNQNAKELKDFSKEIIKEIWEGNISNQKETNINILSLAYQYYYKNSLFFAFPNQNKISIFTYATKKKESESIKEQFQLLKSKTTKKLSNMTLSTSKLNQIPSLNYQFQLQFKFYLKKINK